MERSWNGNDDLRPLQDHELKLVNGGTDLGAYLSEILKQEHEGGLHLASPGCRKF